MYQYMTRQMVALKPLTYALFPVNPGEVFLATPIDADYLTRCGKAEPAKNIEPIATFHAPPAYEPVQAEPPDPEVTEAPAEAVEPTVDFDALSAEPRPRRRGRPTNAERALREAGEDQS